MRPERTLLALILLLTPLAAAAQELPSRDVFRVELLVFARESDEPFVHRPPGEPMIERALPLAFPADGTPLIADETRFWPASIEGLVGARDWLALSRRYELLLTEAWEQTAQVFGPTIPVVVRGGKPLQSPASRDFLLGDEPSVVTEVAGTVALERGRFLHLAVDILYREPIDTGFPGAPGQVGDRFAADQDWRGYRITQQVRVRPGEIQYFDHPRFGILALLTRVEEAAE